MRFARGDGQACEAIAAPSRRLNGPTDVLRIFLDKELCGCVTDRISDGRGKPGSRRDKADALVAVVAEWLVGGLAAAAQAGAVDTIDRAAGAAANLYVSPHR